MSFPAEYLTLPEQYLKFYLKLKKRSGYFGPGIFSYGELAAMDSTGTTGDLHPYR